MTKYFELVSKYDEVVDTPRHWRKKAKGIIVCSGCGAVALGWEPSPINVKLLRPPVASLAAASWIPALVIRKQLAALLREHTPELVVGTCSVVTDEKHEELLSDYCAIYPPRHVAVFVHWGKGAAYRRCDACGQNIPVKWAEPEHLIQSDVDSRPVVQSLGPQFFVREDICNIVDNNLFPDLVLKPIPCLSQPLDDLL